ncbi:hypothetical protein N0V86_000309 [Didymella sp. IMI 355093]|nr:hypothetical protein N0V86_000309 [Didymella sp. IMI 355093]
MPFPFADLPQELRDRTYQYALAAPGCAIYFSFRGWPYGHLYGYPLNGKRPNLSLFLVNRETYMEARRIFYTQTEFHLPYCERGWVALSFLQSRPPGVLPHVRNVHIDFEEWRASAADTTTNAWFQLSQLLDRCSLRHLELRLTSMLSVEAKHITADLYEQSFLAALAKFVSQSTKLHRLQVECRSLVPYVGIPEVCQNLCNVLTKLRDSFLPASQLINLNTETGLRARYDFDDEGGGIADVHVTLDIDRQGTAHVAHEWRTRVLSDQWTRASDDNIWDSERWGGLPLQDYLPVGATVEDFELAQEYLRAGYPVHESGYYPSCGRF